MRLEFDAWAFDGNGQSVITRYGLLKIRYTKSLFLKEDCCCYRCSVKFLNVIPLRVNHRMVMLVWHSTHAGEGKLVLTNYNQNIRSIKLQWCCD
jgi:hypothetical protein